MLFHFNLLIITFITFSINTNIFPLVSKQNQPLSEKAVAETSTSTVLFSSCLYYAYIINIVAFQTVADRFVSGLDHARLQNSGKRAINSLRLTEG